MTKRTQPVWRIDFGGGGVLQQAKELRSDFAFSYKVVIPVAGFAHGLFVERRLTDDDPDYPVVLLVNAHPAQP